MTHRRDRERTGLAGEHRLGDTGQMVLGVVFLLVWCLDTFALHGTTWLNGVVPLPLRLGVGVLLLVGAWRLSSCGMRAVFGEQRPDAGVVCTGVFALVRHPVYLGEMLLYLGVLALSLSAAAAVVAVAAFGFLHWLARYEEGLLLARLGGAYRDYVQRVPMWIPRLRKRTGA